RGEEAVGRGPLGVRCRVLGTHGAQGTRRDRGGPTRCEDEESGPGDPGARIYSADHHVEECHMDAQLAVPVPRNEPVRDYRPGSPGRASLEARIADLREARPDLTMTI